MSDPRLIVGIDASPGVTYGVRLAALLAEMGIASDIVVAGDAKPFFEVEGIAALPATRAGDEVLEASPGFQGMILAPCGPETLARIAAGQAESLLARMANATLAQGRRLVVLDLASRLDLPHIRHMEQATQRGAIVYPPVPAFYARPKDLDEMIAHTLGRVLDLFDIDSGTVRRWRETSGKSRRGNQAG